MTTKREELLYKAIEIITMDRNTDYDEPESNFEDIASLWSTYLGFTIQPYEVAVLNILQKVARIKTSPTKDDHWVDISGYAGCGGECAAAITTLF